MSVNLTEKPRVNFASIKNPLPFPDFLEVQLKSFKDFLQLDVPPEDRKNNNRRYMATKNLSHFETPLPSAADMKFGIVVSEWNPEVTNALRDGAVRTLRECGCSDENIVVRYVPGTFELPMGARFFAEHTDVDGVIALGCVVKGETPHFDYVCLGATKGISDVMLEWNMPVAFGVLTTLDQQQALDRAGGRLGNKGDEAAVAAIKMVRLQREFELSAEASMNPRSVN